MQYRQRQHSPIKTFMTANSVDDAMGGAGRTIVNQSTSVPQASDNVDMEVESPTSMADEGDAT